MSTHNKSSKAENAIGFAGIALLCEEAETERLIPQDHVESKTETSAKNHTNKISDVGVNIFSGLFWVSIIIVFMLLILAIGGLSGEDSSNKYTSTTPATTNQFSKSTKKDYPENKTTGYSRNLTDKPNSLNKKYSYPEIYPPPDGTSLILTQQQIEYCLAEYIRIEAGEEFISDLSNDLTKLKSVVENEKEKYILTCYYTEKSSFCRNWRDEIDLSNDRYNRMKTNYSSIVGRNKKYKKNYDRKCGTIKYYQDDGDNAVKNTKRYQELYRTQGRNRLN